MDAVRLLALLTMLMAGTVALADPAAPALPVATEAPDTLPAPDLPAAPDAPAARPGRADDRSDKVPHRYPLAALALSAVFPGGGQLYTQKYLRAAAFAGTIGFFGYRFYREDRAMVREVDLASASADSAEFEAHRQSYYRHSDDRRSAMWWGIGIWLFSLADAYVDAHLFKFDERAEPSVTLRAAPDGIALCAKF